jgi:GNAT superfamily N-acetyltransferase
MDESRIVIRPATEADRASVQAILADTFETTWRPHLTFAAIEDYLSAGRGDCYVAEHWPAFWVAEMDGKPAGFVHWDGDFIEAVHVSSNHLRRGIGSRLLDHAERAIAAAGFAEARLESDDFNRRSHAVYLTRGYVEKDRYPDDEWNSGFTTLLFAKPLG